MNTKIGLVMIGALAAASAALAQTTKKETLTLDGAKAVLAACEADAKKNNTTGVIAVVDDGGNLIAVHRIDGTFSAGANISIGKARTAAMFKKPTKAFEDIIKNGRIAMVALNDFTPLQGGVPIMVEGQIVGAVGVSGAASAAQDEEIAMAGAAALENASKPAAKANVDNGASSLVTFLDHDKVAAAFEKGQPIFEGSPAVNCAVHASRREQPGQAEVHRDEADVMYVQSGSATLITGGSVLDGKEISSGEVRGTAIEDGQTQQLSRGDVVIIPRGVPHWFREVNGPLLYYVVKVRS